MSSLQTSARSFQLADARWMSGLEVPEEWTRTRVKNLVREMRAGDAITVDAIGSEGEFPVYGANGLRGFTSQSTHRGTHVLIGRQGALCGNVHLVSGEFWASEHAIVVSAGPGVDGRWLAMLLEVMDLGQYSASAAQPGIGVGQVAPLHVYVPPLGEQRAIADYLDRELAQIDALVAKQQELVGALQERRSSIVDLLLMSDSSAQIRLKNLVVRNDGGVWGNDVDGDCGTVVLRSTEQTSDGHWDIADPAIRGLSAHEFNAARLEVGDLVITKTSGSSKHIGKTTLVNEGIASLPSCHGNFMQRLRAHPMHSSKFLWYCLNSRMVREQLVLLSTTSTGLANLNGASIGSVLVPLHRGDRQVAIAERLDEQTSRIDALIAKAEEHITLAKERRSALITAAVTGQIDVRTARKAS